MPGMETITTFETFALNGATLHIPSAGDASLLSADAMQAHLRGRRAGHVLRALEIATSADLHSDLWEMHPAGDEFLFMSSGALRAEFADGPHRDSALLEAGHGLVVPRGVWHRLVLQKPGLLLALSPPSGTRLGREPGDDS
jgi:mannose-6-phosphate isomerase-like protein (cupin superfamily)